MDSLVISSGRRALLREPILALLALSLLFVTSWAQSYNIYRTRFRSVYDFSIWMIDDANIRMNVTVPNNHYFSVGFGKTMTNCDMIIWQANGQQS
jgi:hypothetical protein